MSYLWELIVTAFDTVNDPEQRNLSLSKFRVMLNFYVSVSPRFATGAFNHQSNVMVGRIARVVHHVVI